MKRRTILTAGAAAFAAASALPGLARAALPPEAQPIETLDNALVSIMKAGSAGKSFTDRYQMLEPVVAKVFDLPQILEFSVGLLWSQVPAGQQAELKKVFRQYTVATYVHNFDSYKGQKFAIQPDARSSGGGKVVSTKLTRANGKIVHLDYVMRQSNGGWQVHDVLVDGTISRVATQRSDFSSLVSAGNAQPLIAALKKKVKTLSDGAMQS
jgi:phospholipid transport system substrate-binding protein